MVSLLQHLGFISILEESDLSHPTVAHCFTFLSLIWDTSFSFVALTNEKVLHFSWMPTRT